MPSDQTPIWIALISTVFGGAGLKTVEYFLNRRKTSVDEATQLRGELREEVKLLRVQLEEADKETEYWRDKYYNLRDQNYEDRTGKKSTEPGLDKAPGQ